MKHADQNHLLSNFGFQSYLWTQFLGALNDNLFKFIVAFLAFELVGDANMPLAGAIFILPFLLFSGYAGQAADAFSKRNVLVVTKAMEIFTMSIALFAFWIHSVILALVVLFLMALQSTLFSPAKYGILPEMLPEKHLSNANGWLEMTTFLAIILGSALSGAMYDRWEGNLPVIGLILLSIAVLGSLASLGIARVPPCGGKTSLHPNPWSDIIYGIRRLYSVKALWRTVMGITYFWFLGAVVQMLIYPIGTQDLNVGKTEIGYLMMFLSAGIGAGSLLAGRLSGDHVELGLIPFGSIGMGFFSLLLAASTHSFYSTSMMLILVGFFGGFFIVPLNAYLQKASEESEKGRLIAANNFINMIGVLAASAVYWVCINWLDLSTAQTIAMLGVLTLGVTVYIARLLPYAVMRIVLKTLTHSIFKITVSGREHLPYRGPALLVSNHMSYADGLIVGASVPRYMRFLVFKDFFAIKGIRRILHWLDAIPVSGKNRKDIVNMLRQSRESLQQGDAICLFAEGKISRTGNLLPFQRGFEKIVQGTDTPIIPVHLDGLWGSLFSFDSGRFFWKRPKRFRYPVTVSFGKPMAADSSVDQVRQEILEMGSQAACRRKTAQDVIPYQLIKTAKRNWRSFCMADSTGQSVTYGRALTAAWLASKQLRRHCRNESTIGLMLPSSVGGVLANLGVVLAGKVAVNLNFTAGEAALESAIRQCEIKTIITSRRMLKKIGMKERPGMLHLEDLMERFTPMQKMAAMIQTFLLPAKILFRLSGAKRASPDDPAAILFSSGSTGEPKGITISHYNIIANLNAIHQILGSWENNRVCGILPFFHSLGLTGTLWMPMLKGFGAIYHTSPMEAKRISELCEQYPPGILLATPTFCKGLIRKCSTQAFQSLHHAVMGAERLPEKTAKEFRDKFGADLLEGYGCTETSPVISVNTHDFEKGEHRQIGRKPGTVGHSLPGVAVRVVDLESGKRLPPNTEGLLLVHGPNVMRGYWRRADLTAEAMRDGWYNTGDIASVDEDGFITITDRLSRFSKIGGEMVPHVKIEEAIQNLIGDGNCAVASIPDEAKGERLTVLLSDVDLPVKEISRRLKESGLPPLWIPKPDDMFVVDEIPSLASGKRDLGEIKRMAQRVSQESEIVQSG
ncbi:MAG: MFS transporter [Candidatus Omnitrophica bacterium]|nr:MFS transporter [Candidatus Omnitrophota bacterium]